MEAGSPRSEASVGPFAGAHTRRSKPLRIEEIPCRAWRARSLCRITKRKTTPAVVSAKAGQQKRTRKTRHRRRSAGPFSYRHAGGAASGAQARRAGATSGAEARRAGATPGVQARRAGATLGAQAQRAGATLGAQARRAAATLGAQARRASASATPGAQARTEAARSASPRRSALRRSRRRHARYLSTCLLDGPAASHS